MLVGDIGGTNARFALASDEGPDFGRKMTFSCADYASAEPVISAYLEKVGSPAPSVICIAAAGPVLDRRIRLTNGKWTIDAAELERRFPGARVELLNDFDAIACAIPFLGEADCIAVGTGAPVESGENDFTVGVIGPGTGLGTAGLCRRGGRLFTIGGEGGHVGFAPETRLQRDLLTELSKDYDRVPDERLLSGPGIVNIYVALARIREVRAQATGAAEIFEAASEGKGTLAGEAVEVFFEVLGQVAGNLALSLGALDGVYVAGGIVRRYPEMLANSRFRRGFERKGPYRSMMKKIPTWLITHAEPGLLGASYCALQKLKGGQ